MPKAATMGKKIQLGNLTLDVVLNGRAILNIEKRLGKSVMSLFMSSDGEMKLPPVNEILIVLQGANQTHGVSDKDMVEAFQKYLDQDNSPMDLFMVLSDLFQESGFFGSKNQDDKTKTIEAEEVTLDAEPAEADQDSDSL